MRIYRNSYADQDGEHKGYSFHLSAARARAEAQRVAPDWSTERDSIDIAPGRAALVRALNDLAAHPDNG